MELTTKQLIKKYDKTRQTIYNWIEKGMPYDKIQDGLKKVYRFNEQEVEEWLKKEVE